MEVRNTRQDLVFFGINDKILHKTLQQKVQLVFQIAVFWGFIVVYSFYLFFQLELGLCFPEKLHGIQIVNLRNGAVSNDTCTLHKGSHFEKKSGELLIIISGKSWQNIREPASHKLGMHLRNSEK